MKNLLYIVAVLFLLMWAFGSFVYHVAGALINLLLIAAVVMIGYNLIRRKPPTS